jgi:hypothetical protein
MKHHHFRKEWQELVQGVLVRRVLTYCGLEWMSEKPEGTEFEGPPNESAVDHCRRCLTSKRRDKGDEYMLKHGYPLLDHPLRGIHVCKS